MNQYQRFVSYLYQYRAEEKGQNVGYVRMECRQQQCRLTVRMRGMVLQHMPDVMLFIQKKQGVLVFPVGKMSMRGNELECKLQFSSEHIAGSNYSMDEMDGILLYDSEENYYATTWKNESVYLGEITYSRQESLNVSEEMVALSQETLSVNEGVMTSLQEMVQSKNIAEKSTEFSKINIHTQEVEGQIQQMEEEQWNRVEEGKRTEERDWTEEGNQQEIRRKTTTQESDKLENESYNNKKIEYMRQEEKGVESVMHMRKEMQKNQTAERGNIRKKNQSKTMDNEVSNDLKTQSVCNDCPLRRNYVDYGKKMLAVFPRLYPFQTGKIRRCVKIEPRDIGCLPISFWRLASNPFLMHGYYNYRHLLFVEIESGKYGIGIPGIYTEEDCKTAEIHGFTEFQQIGLNQMLHGSFGYWLMIFSANSCIEDGLSKCR